MKVFRSGALVLILLPRSNAWSKGRKESPGGRRELTFTLRGAMCLKLVSKDSVVELSAVMRPKSQVFSGGGGGEGGFSGNATAPRLENSTKSRLGFGPV